MGKFAKLIPASNILARPAARTQPLFGGESDRFEKRAPLAPKIIGTVSQGFVDTVREAMRCFDPAELALLEKQGFELICARTVIQALPELIDHKQRNSAVDHTDEFNTVGMTYHPDGARKIVIAECYKDFTSRKLMKNPEVAETVIEEISHAVDFIYGDPSQGRAFAQACQADLEAMTDTDRQALSDKWNIALNKLESSTMKFEIFASVYGTVLSGRETDRGFPADRWKEVRRFIEEDFIPGKGEKYPLRSNGPRKIKITIR